MSKLTIVDVLELHATCRNIQKLNLVRQYLDGELAFHCTEKFRNPEVWDSISKLGLTRVWIKSYSSAASLSGISTLTNLKTVRLENRGSVSDSVNLSILSKLTSLENLDLIGIRACKGSLRDLHQLKQLELSDCPFDVDPIIRSLGGLVNLRQLCLDESGAEDEGDYLDLESLSRLNQLTKLEITANDPRVSVEPLTGLRNLEHLELHSMHILDYEMLGHLINLKTLVLSNAEYVKHGEYSVDFRLCKNLESLNISEDDDLEDCLLPEGFVNKV
ncbi:hypothetical protein SARC_01408 [Sphaeroforma arctica JP610]|uniref:Uncharacterized protein n=1 Tax=Sphaeroforma arctica JP610 TaxID=667725 RepID=A0A0L0GBQ8_9EUKA|nr:hypothetical protein SARC_01408 [Sphaeroforma arctica JP610]KNC86452.1 hypothetical protein SARC_01408 [Sphaeroforma arctica JP610]|eukprot:XP_014160354.1 hypothetical protein SARC_01408 [Sphaeroforma arctica JP610]